MKINIIHLKSLCLLISGLICISFITFDASVFAVALPSPGIGVPFTFNDLPQNKKDVFTSAVRRFVEDLLGLSEDGKYSYTSPGTSDKYVGNYDDFLAYLVANPIPEGLMGIENSDGSYSFKVSDSYNFVDYQDQIRHETYIDMLNSVKSNSKISASVYNETLKRWHERLSSGLYTTPPIGPFQLEVKNVNGKPQNVSTIKQPLHVSVFDYLGLKYTIAPNFENLSFNSVTLSNDKNSSSPTYYEIPTIYYVPFFLTVDNKLYVFDGNIKTSASRYSNIFDINLSSGFRVSNSYDKYLNGHFSFGFVKYNNHLYLCTFTSYFNAVNGTFHRIQCTLGSSKLEFAPVVFSNDYRSNLNVSQSANVSTSFKNYGPYDISFTNPLDRSSLKNSDIFSSEIAAVGYFSQPYSDNLISNSSENLKTASQMLLVGDSAVSGGNKETVRDLSPWQKAIYLLSQKNNESYDNLLKKMDLVFGDNGNISVSGLDGISYSVDELARRFEDISETTTGINKELSATLEYLKSLKLDEVKPYISSLEGILKDLNERDKNNSAVIGSLGSSLDDLKNTLNSANLANVADNIASISNAVTKAQESDDFTARYLEKLKVPTGEDQDYRLYKQCKRLLDNLFNYNDQAHPPNFQFYYDSNKDGEPEIYNLLDLSFLEQTLTNENMVDKSWWSQPIKLIDLIRYIIAAVCYGLFVMRLIKRLPTFYGNGPLTFMN